MAIYRTNQKVTVLFFSKNLDANSKKIGIHPIKTCFWIQFHPPLKLVGQSHRMHMLTFLAPRPESSVWVNGICRGILVPKECLEACLQQKKGSRMTFD